MGLFDFEQCLCLRPKGSWQDVATMIFYPFKNPNSYTIGCNFSVKTLYASWNGLKLTGR